jgi:glycosyltransferase involved in cell wall biosynthesis
VDVLHAGLRQRGYAIQGWRSIGPQQTADIFQVHWPEAVFWNRLSMLHERGARFAAERLLATAQRVRAGGGAVIWTIHDLWPHDGIPPSLLATWERFFPALLDQMDGVVSLSRTGLREARAIYPGLRCKPSLVVPHLHFRDAFPAGPGREEARRALGLPERGMVLCCLGQIRAYKGILPLVQAFAAAGTDALLIVGGNCQDAALAGRLRAAADAAGPAVRLELRVLTDQELALIYAAADLAVFNFSSVLNSGSVMTALSLDKRVLAPALGSLVEVAEAVGPDWMRLVERLTPEALREAVAWLDAAPRNRRPDLSAFDPAAIVRLHVNFYRSVLSEVASHDRGAAVPQRLAM